MCFSFDSGSVLPHAGDTRRPAHVAAPQAAAVQRRRAQSVAGGESFDSKRVPTVKFYSSLSLFLPLCFHLVFSLPGIFIEAILTVCFFNLLINV